MPPLRYGGIELVVAHLCEGLHALGAKVRCYSPGGLDIDGVMHFQTMPVASPHTKEGGVPNTQEHLQQVEKGIWMFAQPGDVILFNHSDHYRYLKWRLGLWFRLRHHLAEVAHWVDAGMQQNIIYPSKALCDQLNRPGIVIPHGEKLLFCNDASNAPRKNFIFYAGRITKDKGVDIALAACKIANIPFYVAGPISDREFADSIISDPQVTYLGELTYPELYEYYATAKATAYMTQYTEPFGLVAIEAMAAGSPVITTGKGGTGETVRDGVTGFFCQNAEEMVSAFARLDAILPQQCVERAKRYSIENMAEMYLRYFVNLA